MSIPSKPQKLRTLAVHAGQSEGDGVVAPIHRSSTYLLGEPETFDDIRYIRLNNTPSQQAVERVIGALELGDALVTPSGTAAVHLSMGLFEPGDHLLAPTRLYGGTRKLLDHLEKRSGIRTTYVDLAAPESWEAAREPNTRGFFFESIANPWMSVPDFDAIVAFCRAHDLTSIVDNTLATPVLIQPRALGVDVVVHSASKHLNGHSDVVAGAIIADAPRVLAMRRLANKLGVCPDPQACYLLQRGVKTLPLRVRAQCETAQAMAEMLAAHPRVARVNYPGLGASNDTDSASHEYAARYMSAGGTMLSFTPASVDGQSDEEVAKRVVEALHYPVEAPSLGGVESLVTRPSTTSHAGLTAAYRQEIGIDDAMIRYSVGVEAAEDLLADLKSALDRPQGG